jgi:proton-dependent oligopeptide transporter, POT family
MVKQEKSPESRFNQQYGTHEATTPLLKRGSSEAEYSPKLESALRHMRASSLSGGTITSVSTITPNRETVRTSNTTDTDIQSRSVTTYRAQSPLLSEASDDIPNNVSTEEQLAQLPPECLSGDVVRPLQHFGEDGVVSTYSLQPMFYSVVFILVVELLERFAFYGINYTQTSYLTGEYDYDWNAGMDSVPASSYVSVSVAVAYTTPFIGAFLADSLLGDYYTILVGSLVFYLPGLFLIACTTVPRLLGAEFNKPAVTFGLLLLWPFGTGIVKSVVNVFGAKQFHPLLQSSLIEAYYVNFYMCINIGALIGGILVPVLAQHNVTIAYFLPVTTLSVGMVIFLLGSSRYVRSKPNGRLFQKKVSSVGSSNNTISVTAIAKVSLLTVPFSIVYNQMSTTFIIQGNVMKKSLGWIDAATMNNADAIAVLLFGYIIGSGLYPWLASKGIKVPTTYKFAIGSGFGALSLIWALMVDGMIHRQYAENRQKISVMWQAMAYVLIGIGEIFAVSAAYEVAFTASPPEKKVLFSAVNLFCIGGLPSVFCILLYQLCRPWFTNSNGTTQMSYLSEYATAHVDKYFWLLFSISLFGVLVNLLPSVRRFVESIEERATDMIRTPKTPSRPPRRDFDSEKDEEELLMVKRHDYYLKYGSGPSLYKSGSMRAGPSMKSVSQRELNKSSKRLQKTMISKLYNSSDTMPNVPKVVMSTSGKPIRAYQMVREEPALRSNSNVKL